MKFRRIASATGAAALLVSCGGGGGSSPAPTPTPTPTNQAPVITSDAGIFVDENETDAFYQVFASDGDGDALQFSISGGADASHFSISAGSGEISPVSPLNFEDPSDADKDNVYEVTVSVSDGKASDTQDVTISVQNVSDAIVLTRVATGLGDVADISGFARADILYIAKANGDIIEYHPASGRQFELGNVFDADPSYSEGRLISIAAQTNFEGRPLVHAIQATRSGSSWQVGLQTYGYTGTKSWESLGLYGTQTVTSAQAAAVRGSIARASLSKLFFLTNDGGEPSNAQEDNILGNIVEVTHEGSAGFSSRTSGDGVRNPIAATADGSVVYFADIGPDDIDEINRFEPSESGLNFGWPFRFGREEIRAGGVGPFRDAVLTYDRGEAGHKSFAAMHYYEGYLFGIEGKILLATSDGRFFRVDPEDLESGDISDSKNVEEIIGEFKTNEGTLDDVRAFGFALGLLLILDGDGELYLAENEVL